MSTTSRKRSASDLTTIGVDEAKGVDQANNKKLCTHLNQITSQMEMNQPPVPMVDTNETTLSQLQTRICTLENALRQSQEELRRWKEQNGTDHTGQVTKGVDDQTKVKNASVDFTHSNRTSCTSTTTPLSTHRFHTIQFHPSRPIAFIERLPGSVLIHSLGPFLTGDEMLKLGFCSGRIMNSLHPDFSTAPYHYPSEPTGTNDIWCLKISTRDERFNESYTSCRYFRTEEEANRAKIEEGRQYMEHCYRPEHDQNPLELDEDTPLNDKYAAWDNKISDWSYGEWSPCLFYISRIEIEQLKMTEDATDHEK